jgi:tetratricopeptide (TPR) repeat protein
MKKITASRLIAFCFIAAALLSCKGKNEAPVKGESTTMDLKRGDIVQCGPPGKEFGTVNFSTSCTSNKDDFNLGMALLHSFEYDEAEKVFAKIIDETPDCAMAYWGVAMSNYHPLWSAPTQEELKKGNNAINLARTLTSTDREKSYIEAIGVFYKDWEKTDHKTRSRNYLAAMEKMVSDNPGDKEAALFYALALDATADPSDKTFAQQKKAGDILNTLYPEGPDHPGIVHYIIHTYDYPELAHLALPAARKYASIAPSSAHAQHMPSHIFTRMGLWEESIKSNRVAADAAICYAEGLGMKGHWDEELHALDYLTYAYLQRGQNAMAKKQWDYVNAITEVSPVNFKVLYSFASIPSRYVLENKLWDQAARLEFRPANFPWDKYPWQKAIVHFARVLGNAHTNKIDQARQELKMLQDIRDTLLSQKEDYKANQVLIQVHAGEAWILLKEGKKAAALQKMQMAVDLEDKTEKSPVTPGEVLPARELLADMLLELNKPAEALLAYETDLKKHPNRFNGVYGAAYCSEKTGNKEKAVTYYKQLTTIAPAAEADRPELEKARSYINQPQ